MGGSFTDEGKCIAVDENGNIFIAGDSETSWGSAVNDFAGGYYPDAFAVKLDGSGNRLGNTFMGSVDFDYGESIAVDESGYFYVTGRSYVVWGSPVNSHSGGDDAFAVKLSASDIVHVKDDMNLLTDFGLSQNYPNPFNPSTVIQYTIPQAGKVKLTVYDVQGRIIELLVDGYKQPGQYVIEFQPVNLASGIYFYQLNVNGVYIESRKMLLLH